MVWRWFGDPAGHRDQVVQLALAGGDPQRIVPERAGGRVLPVSGVEGEEQARAAGTDCREIALPTTRDLPDQLGAVAGALRVQSSVATDGSSAPETSFTPVSCSRCRRLPERPPPSPAWPVGSRIACHPRPRGRCRRPWPKAYRQQRPARIPGPIRPTRAGTAASTRVG